MLQLIHLSDCHLTPLSHVKWHKLLNKRCLGYLNWHLSRKAIHQRDILSAIVKDIKQKNSDHTIVTGDLVNLALPEEFEEAKNWLQDLGTPETVSVVPGNHDAYVAPQKGSGYHLWHPFMTSNTDIAQSQRKESFPYIRFLKEKVALIGVSSGVPTPYFMATGLLGDEQCENLDKVLKTLKQQNMFRILLIHHPPLAHQAANHKSLKDHKALYEIIKTHGAEIILHGHNHEFSHITISTPSYKDITHIIGAPSASSSHSSLDKCAGYNRLSIEQHQGGWMCQMICRGRHNQSENLSDIHKTLLLS
ncbi:MAG: metallophosphoesterase [Pseudomonadota bacterium]